MKARYLNQFVSEMFDSWQQDSTRCALRYEIINYVTMATYWFPDLPNVGRFSGFFWYSILIFFRDALFARSSKIINVLGRLLDLVYFSGMKFTKVLKTGSRRMEKSVLPWKHNFKTSVGVSSLELGAHQVALFCCKLWQTKAHWITNMPFATVDQVTDDF